MELFTFCIFSYLKLSVQMNFNRHIRIRVSTEVRFWLPTEYGIFWKTHGIPRNSAEYCGIFCSKIYRNSVEFCGIPYVFAYGIPHVTKWSRFQIPPLKKIKKSWTSYSTTFQQEQSASPQGPIMWPSDYCRLIYMCFWQNILISICLSFMYLYSLTLLAMFILDQFSHMSVYILLYYIHLRIGSTPLFYNVQTMSQSL
jgi:hypothetical protein